ncbi:hypothetical protein [Grimontia sp. SpTr1]|uniref:hypothetical protein n=1 Tax=Grimontia sp. SpTr1 TaxID=2995319 RepID=UPI00248A9F7E|nr:hypothetical protein [Grimontia sp. SpTr1]
MSIRLYRARKARQEIEAFAREQDRRVRNTYTLPLSFNVVAGLITTLLILLFTSHTNQKLKELELKNAKAQVVWQARFDATQQNLAALSELHNFIKFELKESLFQEVKDGSWFDDSSKHDKKLFMYTELRRRLEEAQKIVNNNAVRLSEKMAKDTDEFFTNTNLEMNSNIVINFDPDKVFPILIGGPGVPVGEFVAPDSHYKMVSEMADEFEVRFFNNYQKLEQNYRRALSSGIDE